MNVTDNPVPLREVLSGCRNQEPRSQRQLYELLKGYAARICRSYHSDRHFIEELINESFSKLFHAIHRFEPARYDHELFGLKGWFKRIIINTCLDKAREEEKRRRIRLSAAGAEELRTNYASPIERLAYRELLQSVDRLPPVYRSVFILFTFDGKTHAQISHELGISIGASKSNLFKAKWKLRQVIGINDSH